MLSSPHEIGKGGINASFLIKVFYEPIRIYLTTINAKFLGLYMIFFTIIALKVKNKILNSFILVAFLVVNIYVSISSIGYLIAGDFAAFIIFFVFSDKRVWRKYLVFGVVVISFILTYCFTSDNYSIITAFIAAGQMIFFLIGLIFSDQEIVPHKGAAMLAMMVLSVSGLLYAYTYVYRDEPVKELTIRVEEGIYKGLYTTQGRKQFVEKAEDMLKEEINKEDKICVVTRAPMVYLMANADICAPQTWDTQFLYRGYTSAAPLLDYFEVIFADFWKLRKSYDAVIGNRIKREDGKNRIFVEKIVCLLLLVYFKVKVPDANAPFRLMKAALVEKYIGCMPETYFLPNIMLTAYFSFYRENITFREITFQPRQKGDNSINYKKIVKIGWNSLYDFHRFKKNMRNIGDN